MALDFYVYVGCPLQDPWHPRELIQQTKLRAMLEMLDANRERIEADQERPLEEISVTMGFTARGETREVRTMTVAEIRQAWQQIETRARPICPDCPGNWRGRPIGCFAAVSYPISAAGEQWLIDHFNPPLGERDELLRLIRAEEITGEELDEQRPQSEDARPGLLIAPAPARKRLAQAGVEITSSQLLKGLLACQPALNPPLLFSFCTSFGAIHLDPDDLEAIAACLVERYPQPNRRDDFLSGGTFTLLDRGQDGRIFKMVFGVGEDPSDEDEEDETEAARRDAELADKPGLVSIFEPRPPLRLPRPDATWLKDRLEATTFQLRDEEDDDGSIGQLKRFLYAAWIALQQGVILAIDG